MRDKYQVTEEPCELKGSSTVLESSGSCERIADFTRSCQDAVKAIYMAINKKAKYVLDADIAKCFDRINHKALLEKLNTFPTLHRQIKAWLKSGMMDGKELFTTNEGTPQGGIISPLLANIALHGLENRIKQFAESLPGKKSDNCRSLSLIRYADDFVVLHKDLKTVLRCQQIINDWLKGMGLELKPSKTRISHTLNKHEGNVGFDFLGHTIRQFKVGDYRADKDAMGRPLGFTTIIKPSNESILRHSEEIGRIIDSHKNAPQRALISRLNPVIRGWSNYYSSSVSSATFSKLDFLTYQKLRAWAIYRCSGNNKHEIVNKYWRTVKGNNWCFSTHEGQKLIQHRDTPRKERHIKVEGERSPYDGNWVYWSTRMGKHPEIPSRMANLLKSQQGRCTHCGLFFKSDDLIEVDHITPRIKGGKDKWDNLQALHRHCHDEKTANDLQSGTNPAETEPSLNLMKW